VGALLKLLSGGSLAAPRFITPTTSLIVYAKAIFPDVELVIPASSPKCYNSAAVKVVVVSLSDVGVLAQFNY